MGPNRQVPGLGPVPSSRGPAQPSSVLVLVQEREPGSVLGPVPASVPVRERECWQMVPTGQRLR